MKKTSKAKETELSKTIKHYSEQRDQQFNKHYALGYSNGKDLVLKEQVSIECLDGISLAKESWGSKSGIPEKEVFVRGLVSGMYEAWGMIKEKM